MKRPPIVSVESTIKAYYGSGYIGNSEIREMFGVSSSATVRKLKRVVEEEHIKQGKPIPVRNCVSVKLAFEVWGIDVNELEKNRKKLRELELG